MTVKRHRIILRINKLIVIENRRRKAPLHGPSDLTLPQLLRTKIIHNNRLRMR